MRNLLFALAAIGILASNMGCANGPVRQWCRGAPCSACTPKVSQPYSNFAGGCDSGTCSSHTTGSGFLGNLFRPNAASTVNAPPASIPATSFDQAPAGFATDTTGQIGNSNSEFYGNTTSAGRLEVPPIGPYN